MQWIDLRCEVPSLAQTAAIEISAIRRLYAEVGIDVLTAASSSSRHDGDLGATRVPAEVSSDGASGPATLWPCLTWIPGTDTEPLIAEIALQGDDWVGMVRCWLTSTAVPQLAGWLVGDLPAALAEIRRPLLLDLRECSEPPYQEIVDLAALYPTLPIVLGLAGRELDSHLLAIARSCPNLLIETSGVSGTDRLGTLVARLGAKRFVFGTGFPERSALGEKRRLNDAGWPAQTMEAIGGGNARRLMTASWVWG